MIGDVTEVDGRLTLPFEDGEGQRLVLVDDGGAGPASPWERSPVPAEHQIRGLGPIVLTVHESHAHRARADRGDEHAPRCATMPRTDARDPRVRDGRGRSRPRNCM